MINNMSFSLVGARLMGAIFDVKNTFLFTRSKRPEADSIAIKGHWVIKVIDRETGEVVREVEGHNTMLQSFASLLAGLLTAGNSIAPGTQYYVTLWNTSKNFIKEIAGPTSTSGWTSTAGCPWVLSFSVSDTSTDSYTVGYVTFSSVSTNAGRVYPADEWFAYALSSAVTKNSSQTLSLSYSLSIQCGSAP
jgi:hypothetical protein